MISSLRLQVALGNMMPCNFIQFLLSYRYSDILMMPSSQIMEWRLWDIPLITYVLRA